MHRSLRVFAFGVMLAAAAFFAIAANAADIAPLLVVDASEHTAPIRQVAVDATEKILVTVSDDKSARIWELASGRMLAALRPPAGQDQIGRLYGAAISATGQLAIAGTTAEASGRHRIYLYDLSSRAFVKAIDARGGDVKRLAWSPDGSLLAAAYAGTPAIRVFTAAGALAYEEALPADAWSLAFARDGVLAVPVSDKTIRLYSVTGGAIKPDGKIDATLVDPRGVQFSPDGKLLAVGYLSRRGPQEVRVDVFDVARRTLAKSFSFRDVAEGNLRNVAWTSDGRALYAGGSGYRGRNSFVIKRIGWPDGATSDIVAASSSILDLLPLADGRVVFATSEPSWGVLDGAQAKATAAPRSAQFYEAGVLRINADASQVSWSFRPGAKSVVFDVAKRRLAEGSIAAPFAPSVSSWHVRVTDWENQFHPKINEKAVAMQPTEVSRAVALVPDNSSVILGTSRTLRRLDADARAVWSVSLATEARAVSVTADGRIAVVAMLDGTIVWRRVADAAVLMSLFATTDGKWVLWSPQGYYDVNTGAESLIGWLVNRSDGEQADYFELSRFRDKYYRPDVIDQLLSSRDEAGAIAAANARRQQLAKAADESVRQRVDKLIAPPPVKAILPPVVTLASAAEIESANPEVTIDYRVLNPDAGVAAIALRIDGRPFDRYRNQAPAAQNGVALGRLQISLPRKDATVQIFASNANGVSTPATFTFRWKPPAEPAPLPAPASPPIVASATPSTPAPAAPPAAPPAVAKPAPPAAVPAPPPPAAKAAPPASPPVPAAPSPSPPVVASATPSTPAPAVVDKRPTLYLLAVGVSKYANPSYNLPMAAKDASDFVNTMRQQEGRYYKRVEARLLDNERATRKAVIEGLEWLKQATASEDVGILFVAGHGVNDVDDTYYFAGHDADLDHLAKTAVPESRFRDALASIRGRTIFFVDTCYAGRSVGMLSERDLTRIANNFSSPEYGVIVFSASDGKQESLESAAWGNGAFTKSLVTGLRGAADYRKQGFVTHRGLDYYVGYEVARLTQGKQTPVTMVPVGIADFALATVQQ